MLTPSRTGLFPAPTQKATRVDYSKPSTLRRRSSHGPSPLGRTVSTPPSPVVSKPSRRPLGRKSGGPKDDKENTSATSNSYAADASSNDEASKTIESLQIDEKSSQLLSKDASTSDVSGAATASTENSEEEETYEDELDKLIEEFREWKNDMKETIDDFKRQLSNLQGNFSSTLRAIPTDVIAS